MTIGHWFTDKKYRIRLNKPFSRWKRVNRGVPGGGIYALRGPVKLTLSDLRCDQQALCFHKPHVEIGPIAL